jgi:hypothetical protein
VARPAQSGAIGQAQQLDGIGTVTHGGGVPRWSCISDEAPALFREQGHHRRVRQSVACCATP